MENDLIIRPPESKAMKSSRVVLMPGEEVGEHTTRDREEIIIVIKGEANVLIDGKSNKLRAGETQYVKEGTAHNVKNLSDKPIEYIYIVNLFS